MEQIGGFGLIINLIELLLILLGIKCKGNLGLCDVIEKAHNLEMVRVLNQSKFAT